MVEAPALIVALVDDDYIFQLTASRLLKAADASANVLQFSNGEEALRYLNDHSAEDNKLPDILLLDINMPHVDGWMFLNDYAHLKGKLTKKIKIYMVSSSIDPVDMNRAKSNQSVEDYIIKPISREGFKELIEKSFN
ncbi:response regulator [Chryseotalea sanaruensis]|uniref:Response regulator n=1 Tax=Chryseotalea sanaruensis TaxID=2482724 RepID=A0A401U5M8_9BACT|nr:response regulator [Chryseotalea sanaruensis]GCC50221.1 response regulator [Chryseotalea sanaruensis]